MRLNLQVEKMASLKCLCEHMLEQLEDNVVSFNLRLDVRYFSGTHKIALFKMTPSGLN